MKKPIVLLSIILFSLTNLQAQFHITGSAKTFGAGKFAAGITPYAMLPIQNSSLYQTSYGANLMLGFGITDGIDIHFKFGGVSAKSINAGEDDKAEFRYYTELSSKFQLYTFGGREDIGFATTAEFGIHSWQALAGFDGRINLTFRANRQFYAFTGFDTDYNVELYKEDDAVKRTFKLYYWVPAGIEIRPYENLSIVAEAAIPISPDAAYYTGLGLIYIINAKPY
jgi:hypothetical protein